MKLRVYPRLATVLVGLAITTLARPVDDTKKPDPAKPDFTVYHTQYAFGLLFRR